MKKALKIILHIFSLAALTVLVFSGGLVNKLTNTTNEQKSKKDQPEGLFSAFGTAPVFADTPSGDVGGSPIDYGDGCGDSGCGGCSGSCDGAP